MADTYPIQETKHKMPHQYASVGCWEADGKQYAATWTGKVWWGDGGRELKIVRWQEMGL